MDHNSVEPGSSSEGGPKVWFPQQEELLKKWAEVSSSYRLIHNESMFYWKRWSYAFSIPVIALSTLTGTANFATASFPEEYQKTVPLMIGAVNIFTGIISTIARFLHVDELTESHHSASLGFGKLARNITVELALPPDERNSHGKEFIALCRAEMDRLLEQSPDIHPKIAGRFNLRFKDKAFFKPEIVDISPIEIYRAPPPPHLLPATPPPQKSPPPATPPTPATPFRANLLRLQESLNAAYALRQRSASDSPPSARDSAPQTRRNSVLSNAASGDEEDGGAMC